MYQSQPMLEPSPYVHELPSGLTVVLEPLPYVRSISLGVWIRAGSAFEAPAQAGVTHLLEHLFFKGTAHRSAHDLMDAVESRGGYLNAFTTRDYTCLYIRALDTQAAESVDILADILRHSTFSDFEKEKRIVLEEIASAADIPEDYAHDLFLERLWPGHALGRPVAGYADTVANLTPEAVHAYARRWCAPENLIVSCAGNIDPDAMLTLVERAFDGMPSGGEPAAYGVPEAAAGLHVHEREINQSHFCLGFPAPAVADEHRYVFELLANVLGGGSTSRLFERIREEAGLAYAIYAFNSHFLGSGTLGVYAAVQPGNLDHALELTCNELRDIRDRPIPQAELDTNREQLRGGLLMGLESTFSRMSRMAKSMRLFGRVIPVREVVSRIEAVTVDDVREAAGALFHASRCLGVILGPQTGGAPRGLAL
jgi:predicted Zn-dependent peptidase